MAVRQNKPIDIGTISTKETSELKRNIASYIKLKKDYVALEEKLKYGKQKLILSEDAKYKTLIKQINESLNS